MPRCVSVGTSSLPGNVSVLGFTGNAAGQKLTWLRWTYEARLYNATEQLDACTSVAALLCQQMPRCDTVELFQPNVGYMKGTPEAPLAHTDAIFRASFKQWLDHKPAPLRGTISNHGPLRRLTPMLCKELADRARLVRPGTRSPMRSRQMWEQSFCEEYAATADQPLPALGNDAPPVPPSGVNLHCPKSETAGAMSRHNLYLFVYANKESAWFCQFLRTLAYHNVPAVTVIGWQPDTAFTRPDRVYYFIDRIYAWLRYLVACRTAFGPDALVMLADSDQLMQSSFSELRERLVAHLERSGSKVVFSAESSCMPRKLHNVSRAVARVARPDLNFDPGFYPTCRKRERGFLAHCHPATEHPPPHLLVSRTPF